MTSPKPLFLRRATLGLLLLAYLFLQVQVAVACVVQNLPGVPCGPGAATEISQNDKTAGLDCCEAAYQPASALYDAAAPVSKDATLAGHAPMPMLVAYVDINIAASPLLISISSETSPPGVIGTDIYLTTLRLRI